MTELDRLRALVFDSPDPAASPYFDALLAAEARAAAAEAAESEASLESAPRVRGVVWQSGGESKGPVTRGLRGARPQLATTVRLRMEHVPTSVVHLLDPVESPLLSVRLRNSRSEPARVRITTYVEGYSAQAIDTLDVPPDGEGVERGAPSPASAQEPGVEVHHLPTFFPERLATITEICRATLQLRIEELDGPGDRERILLHRTFAIWLLPRTSALLFVPDPATGTKRDLTRYLAAWVTPNAPGIPDLLRRAASHVPGGSVASYQTDAPGVQAQVAAIYKALREASLTYVNSVLYFGVVPGVVGQRVRLPREALAVRSANCIDGVVLLASLLEAASLHPALVLVPGHAFLAWETRERSDDWDYLETTLLGSEPFERAQAQGRTLAKKYQALLPDNPKAFSRLPLRLLRAQGIWPME
ncbi:MAG TPA: hypothetical protein PKI03_05650 [Pseudomonadota bacterium]|nr:hypothetical protein [Pseudomonadota bacterium]